MRRSSPRHRAACRLLSASPAALLRAPVSAYMARGLKQYSNVERSDRRAFVAASQLAFPDQDPERFADELLSRRRDEAVTKVFDLANLQCGRRPQRVRRVGLPAGWRGGLVVYVHTAWDPVPQLAIVGELVRQGHEVFWVGLPVQNRNDPRAVYERLLGEAELLRGRVLNVLQPNWAAQAVGELRRGATVLLAIDPPIERASGDRHHLKLSVGAARMPISGAFVDLRRAARCNLATLITEDASSATLSVDVCESESPAEAIDRLDGWIAAHPMQWASWRALSTRFPIEELRVGR